MGEMIQKKVLNALLGLQRLSWEQGVTVQMCLECKEDQLLAQLVKASVYRGIEDGRIGQVSYDDSITDACCMGEGLVYMTKHAEGEEKLFYQKALEKLLHWALETAPRSEEGILYHLLSTKEYWVDSVYMLPPFLAAAGYPQEALKQLWAYIDALYDQEAGLFRHRWNVKEQNFTNPKFWGIGNGWVLAGIARMIDLLPKELIKEKEKLISFNRQFLEKVISCAASSYRFHNILDDESSFEEVNLSQMTAYTIYRGIRSGWLDQTYKKYADRMRAAALAEVDEDGFIHNVCGMPNFDRVGIAPEAQAFFLLMENEYKQVVM